MDLTMTEEQLAAASRRAGVRLPFPFRDSGAAVATPDEVGEQLRPTLAALAAPRTTVYAVVLQHGTGSTLHVAALTGDAGSLCLRSAQRQVAVWRVDAHGLVRAVVGAVASFGATTDDAIVPREVVLPARELSAPDGVAGARPGRALFTGTLGAIDGSGEQPRHSRSATWRVYRDGGALAVEAPARPRRESSVTVQAPSERNLTRAALSLLTGLNDRQRTGEEYAHG